MSANIWNTNLIEKHSTNIIQVSVPICKDDIVRALYDFIRFCQFLLELWINLFQDKIIGKDIVKWCQIKIDSNYQKETNRFAPICICWQHIRGNWVVNHIL